MFETSKHVPKTEKRCCVFENNYTLNFTPIHVYPRLKRLQTGIFGFSQKENGAESVAMATT